MKLEEWRSQFKRGTLEFCILLLVRQRDRYGYEIMSELTKHPVIAARESTVYPLLRRLLKEEYLTAYWRESQEGLPPRKYYALTEQGAEYLENITREWENLVLTVSALQDGESPLDAGKGKN